MFYSMSCEEHKYLYGLRREKDSFERLIRERGVIVSLSLQHNKPYNLLNVEHAHAYLERKPDIRCSLTCP